MLSHSPRRPARVESDGFRTWDIDQCKCASLSKQEFTDRIEVAAQSVTVAVHAETVEVQAVTVTVETRVLTMVAAMTIRAAM